MSNWSMVDLDGDHFDMLSGGEDEMEKQDICLVSARDYAKYWDDGDDEPLPTPERCPYCSVGEPDPQWAPYCGPECAIDAERG